MMAKLWRDKVLYNQNKLLNCKALYTCKLFYINQKSIIDFSILICFMFVDYGCHILNRTQLGLIGLLWWCRQQRSKTRELFR